MTIQTPLWEFVDISKAYPGVLANDKVNIKSVSYTHLRAHET